MEYQKRLANVAQIIAPHILQEFLQINQVFLNQTSPKNEDDRELMIVGLLSQFMSLSRYTHSLTIQLSYCDFLVEAGYPRLFPSTQLSTVIGRKNLVFQADQDLTMIVPALNYLVGNIWRRRSIFKSS